MSRAHRAERVKWHRGAELRSGDLTEWAAYEPELLALHVRALHGTWGVLDGLAVMRTADRRAVVVSPGTAYTCAGDVVGLAAPAQLAAPPGTEPGALLLVLSPAEAAERRCGAAAPPCPDAVPAVRTARLRWLDSAGPAARTACGERAADVPLARVVRLPDGTLGEVSYTVRPIARPFARPRIGRGGVVGGELTWHEGALSISATIDTSDAQFSGTPLYFVSLYGLAISDPSILGPFISLGKQSRDSVEVTLRFAAQPALAMDELFARVRPPVDGARIDWLGIDRAPACRDAAGA